MIMGHEGGRLPVTLTAVVRRSARVPSCALSPNEGAAALNAINQAFLD
jgi:hypothetical protein